MTLTYRLTLGFFVITLAALGVVFSYVIPTLESRLRDEKVATVERAARAYGPGLGGTFQASLSARQVNGLVSDAAQQGNARVTLLNVAGSAAGTQLIPIADSSGQVRDPSLDFAVAVRAAGSGRVETGTEAGGGGRMAEAAFPLRRAGKLRVAVFSTQLNDVSDTVSVIRRRVLIAGGLAVLIAGLLGWVVARALSQRIKRLEGVARRVARGDFSARFPVDRADELGQLATALD